jgi:ketosteroid isomerase-like protein
MTSSLPSPSSSSSAEANIETVRRAIDAFNRGDVDAMLALATEDFVYDWSRSRLGRISKTLNTVL